MRKWFQKWRNQDDDLADELQSHLEIERAQQMNEGRSSDEAEYAARAAFGNVAKTHEQIRGTWGWTRIEGLLQDANFGLRMLRKTPMWTAVVCLTLALGIGMSTAIFSVVHAVLLQPLPYPEPDRVVAIAPVSSRDSRQTYAVSPALWRDWRQHLSLVTDVALTRPVVSFNLTGSGPAERLQAARITHDVPLALRASPLHGRLFSEEEQNADAKVALLSFGLWTRRFGADPMIVGRKIELNGQPHEVIGVMPPDFRYPDANFDLWAPLYLPPNSIVHGFNYGYLTIARLKPGATVEQAQSELAANMRRLADEHPESYREGSGPSAVSTEALLEPLAQRLASTVRPTLYVLSAAVLCLLLIGCMNLAVLLIARASARSREMVVRVALGASAGRLRNQLLAEAIPLGLAGASGGVLVAWWMLRALLPLLPANMPRTESVGVNGAVIAFAVLVSLLIVIAASLLPSRLAGTAELSPLLQQNSRGLTGGGRLRDLLVAGQIAVALLLLFGGALFARSFSALLGVSPGFSSEGVLTMHLAVSRAKFPQDADIARYYGRLIDRVRALPGVIDAGVINRLPMSGLGQTGEVEFEGKDRYPMADWRSASPGYFAAMGIPLKQGRLLAESDRTDGPLVGVIDEALAKRVFGNENPIGHRFRSRGAASQPQTQPWAEIVGVVGHVLNDSLESDLRPQVYWPETQRLQDRAALVVRVGSSGGGGPESYAKSVIGQIQAENPDQPVFDVRSMDQWIDRSMQGRTLTTSLISIFGGASLLLACLGLYGVVSYATGLRLREFGVRLALGAGAGEVFRLVLMQAGRLAAIGVALGLLLCWPASQAIRSMLFGVSSFDLVAWVVVPVALIGVALVSALGPALRASRTDPVRTLRDQ